MFLSCVYHPRSLYNCHVADRSSFALRRRTLQQQQQQQSISAFLHFCISAFMHWGSSKHKVAHRRPEILCTLADWSRQVATGIVFRRILPYGFIAGIEFTQEFTQLQLPWSLSPERLDPQTSAFFTSPVNPSELIIASIGTLYEGDC